MEDFKPLGQTKTYIIQFMYPKGNGWAFVNARSVAMAQSVFNTQTRYEDAKVISVKETKWYGTEMQLVYEGAVTTCTLLNVTISLSDLIKNTDAFDSVEEYLDSIYNLSDYYTKEEIDDTLSNKVRQILIDMGSELPNLDLTDYVKKTELSELVREEVLNLNIKDGVTPEIDPVTKHWVIDGQDTGVVAEGQDGQDGKDGQDGINGTNGTNGTNGNDGADGVSVSNVIYVPSNVSGGINKLTIVLSNGNTFGPYNILNGKDGRNGSSAPSEGGIEIVRGSMQDAIDIADQDDSVLFSFILDTEDVHHNPVTKVIWHIGQGVFIDAFGTIMS